MSARFAASFVLSFLIIGTAIALAGWVAIRLLADAPRAFVFTALYSFELPEGWRCTRQGTEQVCGTKQRPNPAIAIITAKYRGPQDTMEAYEAHLKKPQPVAAAGPSKATEISRVEFVRRQRIAGRDWVVALHFGSEVPNYYTYYYAGLSSHVAALMTFSVHKDHVQERKPQIDVMVSTLSMHQRPVMPSVR